MIFNPNDSRYSSAVGAWLKDNFEQQFTTLTALTTRLLQSGGIKYGAAYLVQPVSKDRNPSVQGVSNFTAGMSIPADQGLSAVYTWSWYQGLTTITKQEEVAINTEYDMVNLLEARVRDTIASFNEVITTDLFSSTNSTQGKVAGIPYVVDAPTAGASPVGGVDRVANPWWRAQKETGVGTLTMQKINRMYNLIQGATGQPPDIILMPTDLFGAYESLILASQRFTQDQKMAQAGFTAYLHKGATVLFDTRVPAGQIYYLNTRYIYLVVMTREPSSDPVDFPDRLVKGYKHWYAVQLVASRLNGLGRQEGVTV